MTNLALFRYLLKIGDDLLINAQRLCEWTGHGPFLEEDLALTNIALDLFGQANAFLEYAAKVEGKGRDQDALAFHRNDTQFLNAKLVEIPNGDYAQTILKQALIDSFRYLLYQELVKSSDQTIAGIASKGVKEVTYHRRHTHQWVIRFGNGTNESMERLNNALGNLWKYTGDLFESDEDDAMVEKSGVGVAFHKIFPAWEEEIKNLFSKSNLRYPENVWMIKGGRKGVHTEYLSYLLNEMQMLPRMYPDAKW
ncbi:MAG: phenylacetate-CoA oxygenase subunit PaaC [Bacteroidia bacterium]|nr:phenylacetate-CoA oxygenase subunit PaaC [Bacteroidia bacterium]